LILYAAHCSADILVFSAMARHQIEEEFRDMPAKFGGVIPPEGIKVYLFYFIVDINTKRFFNFKELHNYFILYDLFILYDFIRVW